MEHYDLIVIGSGPAGEKGAAQDGGGEELKARAQFFEELLEEKGSLADESDICHMAIICCFSSGKPLWFLLCTVIFAFRIFLH